MKDQLFIAIGKLAVAMLAILAFLGVGVLVSNASDRYNKGQKQMIDDHKAELIITGERHAN